MRLFELCLVAAAAVVAVPRTADACSLADNGLWVADPTHSGDRTAPSLPEVVDVEVLRNADSGGCVAAGCGDRASIHLALSATDDRAQPDLIGYEIRVAGGQPPRGLDPMREGRVRGGQFYFFFDYGAPGFTVDLEVRAVDLNGNLGPPVIVTVSDAEPSAGCMSVARQHGLVTFGLVLLVLGWVTRRRYRC
jgi:hypothetical protein